MGPMVTLNPGSRKVSVSASHICGRGIEGQPVGKDFIVSRTIQDGLGVSLAPNLMLSPFHP